MKVTTIIITWSAVLTALFAVSCVKETGKEVATEQTDFSSKAFVQVYNGTVNTTARNYVYVDGNAVNGASMGYGASFPVTSTPAYFSITSGVKAFLIRDTLIGSTQPPMSFAENFEASKYYSIFMYDTGTTVKQKTVLNNIVIPTDTSARLRFAYFAYSSNAIPAVDIFSVKRNANIFSNVSVTEVTDFISFDSRKTDTLIVRVAGSGTDLLNRTVSGTPPVTTFSPVQLILTPTRLRNYTVVFRGGYRTDLTSASTVRTLSLLNNN